MILELPWPPSTNHTWKKGRGRVYLSAETRRFREDVAKLVMASRIARPITGPIEVSVTLCPPDKRRRDEDNFAGKSLFDAMTHAGVWLDDSQIRRKVVEWGEVVKGGCVKVEVVAMPQCPNFAQNVPSPASERER